MLKSNRERRPSADTNEAMRAESQESRRHKWVSNGSKNDFHPCVLAPKTMHVKYLLASCPRFRVLSNVIRSWLCSDAHNSTASPAKSAETQPSTTNSLFTAASRFASDSAHLAHSLSVAGLITDSVACRETEGAHEDNNAGADNPSEESGADLLDQSALLACLFGGVAVSAAASHACDGGAGFSFGLV